MSERNSRGVGFLGLLTLLFVGLKLAGVIGWSWVWVLAPIWVPLALILAVLATVGLVSFIAGL